MPSAHVFVETNFLFGIFRMPSKRHRDALRLKLRFEAGEIKLYIPYLCFQEALNKINKSLSVLNNRHSDLMEFHRLAVQTGTATWEFDEVKRFLEAATAEVNRTKAVCKRELTDFATVVGDGVLHGTNELFDFLESLELDDALEYNDKLILSSVLWQAKKLQNAGVDRLFFLCLDKKHLGPTLDRPKLTHYYNQAGLIFVSEFVLPEAEIPPT
jgi:predicted nucleic acid-binding protein